MPAPAPRTARRPRPSYLSPPPLLAEHEPFEGAALLREAPGPLGLVLWKTLRDLSLWTAAPENARAGLFPADAARVRREEIRAAGAPPELWAPLLVAAGVLEDPARVDVRRLANACRAVARWEGRAGAVRVAFAQAAALLAPESARLAYAVGRAARDGGEYARGESWLRTAVRLSRGRDWHTYALAHLSLGTLYQQLGNLPAARTLTMRGWRAARRRRVAALEGTALHNLCVLAAEAGEYPSAHEYAHGALERYGPDHPRLAALAYDVGCLWFLCGWFARALGVLQAVVPRMPDDEVRVMALANLARAAAGAGRTDLFPAYWEDAVRATARYGEQPCVAEAWLALARGAVSAGEPALAVAAAARAGEIALARRLGQVRMEADAVRESARGARPAPVAPPAAPARMAVRADQLSRLLLERLQPAG